jgi:hypothetical protein
MPEQQGENQWNYTRRAGEEFGGKFGGRRLIARDSKISGGVYYGTYGGEAIVVDPTKYPKYYDKWYKTAVAAATEKGKVQRNRVLGATFSTVSQEMPYSQAGVDRVLARIAKRGSQGTFEDGTKVELSAFMHDHVGVCRHQALVVGALLERFVDDGHIRGSVSVDRNIMWQPTGDIGGHAWVRYTTNGGTPYILDVAQGYFGTLADSPQKAQWNYLRPEEQQMRTAIEAGRLAMPNIDVA